MYCWSSLWLSSRCSSDCESLLNPSGFKTHMRPGFSVWRLFSMVVNEDRYKNTLFLLHKCNRNKWKQMQTNNEEASTKVCQSFALKPLAKFHLFHAMSLLWMYKEGLVPKHWSIPQLRSPETLERLLQLTPELCSFLSSSFVSCVYVLAAVVCCPCQPLYSSSPCVHMDFLQVLQQFRSHFLHQNHQ